MMRQRGRTGGPMLKLDALDFEKGGGQVTVVTQDARSGVVLMVAHVDREALEKTLATGEMHYRSRSRGLWHKGETSGNTQKVVALEPDCDGDAVLARVIPAGPACHTGSATCFGDAAAETLGALDRVIAARAAAERGAPADEGSAAAGLRGAARAAGGRGAAGDGGHAASAPAGNPSYTRKLLADRNLRLKKLGEEAAELALACADGDPARAAEEGADLFYHALVALRACGVTLDDVRRVLEARSSPATGAKRQLGR